MAQNLSGLIRPTLQYEKNKFRGLKRKLLIFRSPYAFFRTSLQENNWQKIFVKFKFIFNTFFI